MSLADSSSAGRGKRAGPAIAGIRPQSPHIGSATTDAIGGPEAFGDLVGIEPKAGPPARTEAAGTQLVGVVIDPAPADPPPSGYLLGGNALAPLGAALRGNADQLRDPLSDRLDRLWRKVQLLRRDIATARHRRRLFPKGPRRTPGFGVPSGAQ